MAVTERSDAELLERARDGDEAALGELYLRHRPAALRLARSYGNAADAEDLVNGAFERVLAALRRGHGPAEAFRPYLFVTIRRLAGDRAAASGDDAPLDDVPEAVTAAEDPSVVDLTDRRLVAEAFAALPDRWQTVLWHTAIEGRRPREVARATGLPANTVSVMAHRARERLRQAYLQAHVGDRCPAPCAATRERLGRYVRGPLAHRTRTAVEAHVAGCEGCRTLAAELRDVNRLLARSVAPLFVLAGGAEATLGAAGVGGAGTGAATGAAAAAGSAATVDGTATLGGAAATGGAAAAGATGAGLGVVTVAKVAATIAAVVGLVAVSPIDLPAGGGDGRGDVEVGGSAPGEGPRAADTADGTSTTVAGDPAPPGAAPPGVPGQPGMPGSTAPGAGDPAVDVDAGVDLEGGVSVDAQVGLSPAPGVDVDAQVGVGVAERVDLRVAWRAGLLGSGNLVLTVLNGGSSALVGGELVVDLSPGAHATSLLGGTCRASDGGLVGVVVDLLRSLTCGLAEVGSGADASLSLPLTVLGGGQTATVRLVAGGADVASTVVDLAG